MINSPGVNEFIDLKDAPNSYAGQASKIVTVNAGETAVEFGTGGPGGATAWGTITGALSAQTDLQNALNAKQDTLVSGTNIKTINGNSLLGSGNLVIGGSGGVVGQADVNFGPITIEDSIARVTVNTASVTTSSIIQVSPAGIATTDHDPDDYQWDNLSAYVSNIINGVSFDIIGVAPNGSWGAYTFNYLIN